MRSSLCQRAYLLCVSPPRPKKIWPQWSSLFRPHSLAPSAYPPRAYSTGSNESPSPAAWRNRGWSQEELDKLVQLHKEGMSTRAIANMLGRSFLSVKSRHSKAVRYGTVHTSSHSPTLYASRTWSKDELDTLKDLRAAGDTWEDIAAVLNRTQASVRTAVRRHLLVPNDSMQKFGPWSEADVATTREMREEGMSYAEIALAIGRSLKSVEGQAEFQRKTPLKAAICHKLWSETEIARLVKLKKQGLTSKQISTHLPGRTAQAVDDRWRVHRRGADSYKPRKRQHWTADEKEMLERLRAQGISRSQIAKRMGRSLAAVSNQTYQSLAPPLKVPNVPWTPSDIIRLFALRSESRDWAEVGRLLGRTPRACKAKLFREQQSKDSSA